MNGVEIDKCSENFTVKIPEILKVKLDRLSAPQKAKMKQELLYVMAKTLHRNEFDPEMYLSSKD